MTHVGYAISIRVSGKHGASAEQRQLQRGLDWVEMYSRKCVDNAVKLSAQKRVFSPLTPRSADAE